LAVPKPCDWPIPETALYPRYAEPRLTESLADSPVVLIHGPRQCGKTTLARMVGESRGYPAHEAHFRWVVVASTVKRLVVVELEPSSLGAASTLLVHESALATVALGPLAPCAEGSAHGHQLAIDSATRREI